MDSSASRGLGSSFCQVLREELPGQVYKDLDGALEWVQLKSLAWLLGRGVYMVRLCVGVQASPTTNLQGSKGH
jgi:hypothetical protein